MKTITRLSHYCQKILRDSLILINSALCHLNSPHFHHPIFEYKAVRLIFKAVPNYEKHPSFKHKPETVTLKKIQRGV